MAEKNGLEKAIEETKPKDKTSINDPVYHFLKHGWVEINDKLYVNDSKKKGPSMYKDKDGVYKPVKD